MAKDIVGYSAGADQSSFTFNPRMPHVTNGLSTLRSMQEQARDIQERLRRHEQRMRTYEEIHGILRHHEQRMRTYEEIHGMPNWRGGTNCNAKGH